MNELQNLKDKLFMLEMCDTWTSEDYRTAEDLRNEIWKLEHPNQERKVFI